MKNQKIQEKSALLRLLTWCTHLAAIYGHFCVSLQSPEGPEIIVTQIES
jgi:hypothetical protein